MAILQKNLYLILVIFTVTSTLLFAGCINPPSPPGSRIIFESSRDMPQQTEHPQKYIELYSMKTDGSMVIRITNNLYWEHKPQVSQDGKKILVTIHFSPEDVDETDPGWEIAVMNINGTGLRKLTNNSYLDINAKWNKDGTKIVYVSDSNHRTTKDLKKGLQPQYDIYTMNPDGTGKTRLTSGEAGEVNADPCFSPTGGIYYVHSENYSNNFDLWRMNEDGTEKQVVFTHNQLVKAVNDPSLSNDGTKIVFEGRINNDTNKPLYNLFTLNTPDGNLTRLTNDDGESDVWPSFSPDDQKIVYFTYKWDANGGHTQRIRVINSDGNGEKEISSYPWESFPSWFNISKILSTTKNVEE